MDGDQLAHLLSGGSAGVGGRLHSAHVAPDHDGHKAAAHLLLAHQLDDLVQAGPALEKAHGLLPVLEERLKEKHVEMRADEKAREYMPEAEEATEEDWGKEYLDYIVSIKTVSSIDEAIAHINRYNTKHSEAIITNNYTHAQKFLDEIDAAVVYVNASTRFTDGFEFGYGAEIGISTQKLHARGPMGLLALTSIKNIVYGTGQIRK